MRIQKIFTLPYLLVFTMILIVAVGCSGGESRSIGEMRAESEAAATEAAVTAIESAERARTELPTYCVDNPDRCVVEGNPDAPVKIYEVSDYGCPACKSFNDSVLPQLQEQYIDDGSVALVKVPVAILSNRDGTLQSPVSPEAVLCAHEQGNGSEYHSALFIDQSAHKDHAINEFVAIAKDLGLDGDEFESCLEDDRYRVLSAENRKLALSLGVQSTPSFFIDGELITGANLQPISAAVERSLNK